MIRSTWFYEQIQKAAEIYTNDNMVKDYVKNANKFGYSSVTVNPQSNSYDCGMFLLKYIEVENVPQGWTNLSISVKLKVN